jgi:hypothetical protein
MNERRREARNRRSSRKFSSHPCIVFFLSRSSSFSHSLILNLGGGHEKRLHLSNNLIVKSSNNVVTSSVVQLNAGRVPITIYFAEASGNVFLQLSWSGPGFQMRKLSSKEDCPRCFEAVAMGALSHTFPRSLCPLFFSFLAADMIPPSFLTRHITAQSGWLAQFYYLSGASTTYPVFSDTTFSTIRVWARY